MEEEECNAINYIFAYMTGVAGYLRRLVMVLLLVVPAAGSFVVYSQEVPHPISNKGVYDFIDELANEQIISVNSAVKPYSRMFIALKLQEAEVRAEELNGRQRKELAFYMMDFRKELGRVGEEAKGRRGASASLSTPASASLSRLDLFYYRDSLFSLTVNPILGGEMFSNSGGRATYWRNGAEARGYVGKWGFYASLRDNHEKPLLGRPEFLTNREGGHLKGNDWSEMQGGITYAWKWGSAGLVKERIQWGNNYNGGNIFGGNNPTYMQFKLHISPVKWFDFNYFHGWLNSQVVDSTRSYWVTNSYGADYREVYHKKFIAANMFTFTPFRNLNLSAGNSIVYSDNSINPAYLVPLFFYKSVDHSQTSGIDNMNSQLFIDVSSRQIKNLHIYGTLFVDELSVSRFTKDDEWNFFSWKGGLRLSNFPVENLSFTTELTYTYPLTFQHYVPTLTFENAGYNLGHYMKDNSREIYAALDYRPYRTVNINLFFRDAIRGPDYTIAGVNRLGNPPLASTEWHDTSFGLKASGQIINDVYCWGSFVVSDISGEADWSAAYYYGNKKSVGFGVTVGF